VMSSMPRFGKGGQFTHLPWQGRYDRRQPVQQMMHCRYRPKSFTKMPNGLC
jgi:hypothetical protein